VAKRYTLVEGDLYRHGANDVLIRCITKKMVVSCSQRSIEVSAAIMLHLARWSVKPFGLVSTGLQPSRMSSNW
jgi:hypothetical protein